jgi:hypothetical protein
MVVNQVHNLDLQNVEELKHHSSFMFPRTCTMVIFANLKYFGKEQERILDVERVLLMRDRILINKFGHGINYI